LTPRSSAVSAVREMFEVPQHEHSRSTMRSCALSTGRVQELSCWRISVAEWMAVAQRWGSRPSQAADAYSDDDVASGQGLAERRVDLPIPRSRFRVAQDEGGMASMSRPHQAARQRKNCNGG